MQTELAEEKPGLGVPVLILVRKLGTRAKTEKLNRKDLGFQYALWLLDC